MPGSDGSECFVDTNVWLYAFVQADDPAKCVTARELLRRSSPVVSTQVINEVCVNRLRRASFTESQVRDLVQSFHQKCRVIELSEPVLIRDSELRERYSLSFWDGLIVAAALIAGVTTLVTEDLQHGLIVNGILRVENPFMSE